MKTLSQAISNQKLRSGNNLEQGAATAAMKLCATIPEAKIKNKPNDWKGILVQVPKMHVQIFSLDRNLQRKQDKRS